MDSVPGHLKNQIRTKNTLGEEPTAGRQAGDGKPTPIKSPDFKREERQLAGSQPQGRPSERTGWREIEANGASLRNVRVKQPKVENSWVLGGLSDAEGSTPSGAPKCVQPKRET